MRTIKEIILLLLLSTFTVIFAEDFPKLSIYAEDWEPYHYYNEMNHTEGYVIELVDKILKDIGNNQTRNDILILPWARGYKLTQLKKNSVIFSTTRTPEREKLFKWVGPIFNNKMCLVTKKSNHITISSDDDINHYKIGTLKDDVANILLNQRNVSKKSIIESGTSQENIKLLEKDRVDLIGTTWFSFLNFCKELGIDHTKYERVYNLSNLSLYFAFNNDTEDWVVDRFRESFNSVKGDIPELLDL